MDNVDKRFVDDRNRLMALLVQESSLMEIVKLIGATYCRMTRSWCLNRKGDPSGVPAAECIP